MSEMVIGQRRGLPRRRKPGKGAFTPARRQRFLDALALSCNVRAAADHAGVDHSTVYYHRARDPQFCEQWQAAIETGYDRLEELVLLHGGAGQPLEPADPARAEGDPALPAFDFDRAMAVLKHYRGRREGRPFNHGGRPPHRATREETNAALIRALDSIERRLARKQEREGGAA